MTYLELVNEVLARLREDDVSSIDQTTYSILIGKFVNDAKRHVEDAWNWESLNTTITVTTDGVNDRFLVTGSGRRHKQISVNDSTNKSVLHTKSLAWIQQQNQLTTTTPANPFYYAWSGTDGTDSYVTFFPVPNGVYSIKFNLYVPQVDLVSDTDVLAVPHQPVVAHAYARAIAERGEDGGLASSEALGIYRSILADFIALESQRNADSDTFEVV